MELCRNKGVEDEAYLHCTPEKKEMGKAMNMSKVKEPSLSKCKATFLSLLLLIAELMSRRVTDTINSNIKRKSIMLQLLRKTADPISISDRICGRMNSYSPN